MLTKRSALLGAGLAALAVGLALAFGAPRITLVNAGLWIEYPWPQGAGTLAAATGLGLIAACLSLRWARTVLAIGSGIVFLVGVDRLAYRLEADDQGLASRGWLGAVVVPWAEVTRVESGPAVIVVWGAGDNQVRVDTSDFEPQQRATLDRTIARRVKSSGGSPQ